MNPIKIMLFFAAFGRADVLRVTCLGIQRLSKYKPDLFSVDAFCVYSGSELKPILDEFGIASMEYQNNPVGTKKNAGLNELLKKEYDWEYLLEMGADDLISNKLLDLYLPYMIANKEVFGIKSCHLYDIETARVAHWENTYIIGLGRAFHRDAFRKLGGSIDVTFNQSVTSPEVAYSRKRTYRLPAAQAESFIRGGLANAVGPRQGVLLWDAIDSGLDFNSEIKLLRKKIRPEIIETGDTVYAVDLKDRNNMHLFECYEPYFVQGIDVLKSFSKKEKDAIRSLRPVDQN